MILSPPLTKKKKKWFYLHSLYLAQKLKFSGPLGLSGPDILSTRIEPDPPKKLIQT